MTVEPQWRTVPGSLFRWREWDGEFVLYHESSGDTHRLNPLGARAVMLLLASAAGVGELSGRLATEFALEGDAELTVSVDRLLLHLYGLGLIEPVAIDDGRKPDAV
jgi:PqqD family protein of HPr-rel-A system